MIKFGFRKAVRQGGCAYFTRLTFWSRLQIFDWHAVQDLFLSPAKEINPPCFEKTQSRKRKHTVRNDTWHT